MNKFINKECNSNVGINLVLNRDISFNNNNKSIKYKIILENFKNLLNKKIHNFDPLSNEKDYYNNIIKSMLFQYIYQKTTQKSYNELFEYLNIEEMD